MRRLCLILACLLAFGAWSAFVSGAPSNVCPGRPFFVDAGRSDILGTFAALGIRCQLTPAWTASTGLRYTDQRQSILPFLILTYSRPLTTGLNLTLTASSLERAGDYEIDRLPEIMLQWAALQNPASVSIQVFAGGITTTSVTPRVQTSRIGTTIDMSTTIRLSPSVDITPNLRFGSIGYGTGDNHEFWVSTTLLVIRPTSKTDLGLAYLKQDGRGRSPLLFDAVTFDHTLTGWIGLLVMPTSRVGLSATATLFTMPSWTMKEYTLSWAQFGAWTASVTWRQLDGRVLLGFSLAQ